MRWFWSHRNKFCRTYNGCWTDIKVLPLPLHTHFFVFLHVCFWKCITITDGRSVYTLHTMQVRKCLPIPSPLSRNLLVVVEVNGMWLFCDHCFLYLVCLTCNCSNVLVVAIAEEKNPQDNNRKISINFFKNHSLFFFFFFCFYYFCYKFVDIRLHMIENHFI